MNRSVLAENSSEFTLYDAEWKIFVEKEIPVTVFLAVLSVVGTFGNVMVILTVGRCARWSNHRVLIQCLALVDCLSCALSIPGYIALSRFRFTIKSDALCRGTTMFHIFVGGLSVDLLCFTCIERFRKTCRPFGKQLSLKHTKIACACLSGFNIALATLGLFTFSVQNIPVGHLTGHICRINKEGTFAKIFSQILSILLFLKIVISTILYGIVGKTILLQRRQRPMMASFKSQNSRSMKTLKELSTKVINGGRAERISSKSTSSFQQSFSSQISGSKRQMCSKLKGKALYTKSAQISFMFLMCTFLSFLSFVPVLIIRCVESFDWHLREDMFEYLGPMAGIFYRFHVMNHVINPVVYCLTNSNFRRDFTDLCKCRT